MTQIDGYKFAAQQAVTEAIQSREKFPGNRHMLPALMEEVGELARALLQGEGHARVRAEAYQVAAVALRIAVEGDSDFNEQAGGQG